MTNKLFYGDNLDILRNHIADESVDLIYLDPPFNSNRNYNVLFRDESGKESEAQITAFEDTWHWTEAAEETYYELVQESAHEVSTAIEAMRKLIGTNQMMAYLVMMAARLVELHRVLKPTGSLYLHCDPTASHYLKILLDAIFGVENYRNEIVWKRTTAHNDPIRYGRIHDVIFYYTKSDERVYNHVRGEYSPEQLKRYKYSDEKGHFRAENLTAPNYSETRTVDWRGTHPGTNRQWRFSTEELERLYADGRILLRRDGKPRKDGHKVYLEEAEGSILQDVWTDIQLAPTAAERLGYPTQKPVSLLERIIAASSNEGDVVLDPFCGCGTAISAAQKLGRQWIGIDITHLSISLQKFRLKDEFDLTPGKDYQVVGEPKTVEGARALATDSDNDGRYQFQFWALSLIQAKPLGGQTGSRSGKKGADKGIDGVITFFDGDSGKPKPQQVMVQVKSGKVKSGDIRDLVGTVEREKAAIGVFITLEEPTSAMQKEAVSAGFYESPMWGDRHPRIQILTIEQLLKGAKVDMPPQHITFKQAQRINPDQKEQKRLL